MDKLTFKTKDEQGNEISLDILRPTMGQEMIARDKHYMAKFMELFHNPGNFFLRDQLDQELRKRGVWDDTKEEQRIALLKKLSEGENKLRAGGIPLSEAKKIALCMAEWRTELLVLTVKIIEFDKMTIESEAENESTLYLLSQCTVYSSTGQKYFKDKEDVRNRGTEQATIDAAYHYGQLVNNYDPEFLDKLPENKFIKDYDLVEKSEPIEFTPFLDEDGNPVNPKASTTNE